MMFSASISRTCLHMWVLGSGVCVCIDTPIDIFVLFRVSLFGPGFDKCF